MTSFSSRKRGSLLLLAWFLFSVWLPSLPLLALSRQWKIFLFLLVPALFCLWHGWLASSWRWIFFPMKILSVNLVFSLPSTKYFICWLSCGSLMPFLIRWLWSMPWCLELIFCLILGYTNLPAINSSPSWFQFWHWLWGIFFQQPSWPLSWLASKLSLPFYWSKKWKQQLWHKCPNIR